MSVLKRNNKRSRVGFLWASNEATLKSCHHIFYFSFHLNVNVFSNSHNRQSYKASGHQQTRQQTRPSWYCKATRRHAEIHVSICWRYKELQMLGSWTKDKVLQEPAGWERNTVSPIPPQILPDYMSSSISTLTSNASSARMDTLEASRCHHTVGIAKSLGRQWCLGNGTGYFSLRTKQCLTAKGTWKGKTLISTSITLVKYGQCYLKYPDSLRR